MDLLVEVSWIGGVRFGVCADLVCRTKNAICASVIDSAAMMRSPSFSRSWSSRTIMNSPFSVEVGC